LLAENNSVNAKVLGAIFSAQGYSVRRAGDAEAAFLELTRWRPGFLLVDLPGPDGVALARRVRSFPGLREMAIIGVMPRRGRSGAKASGTAPFDACIAKPLEPKRLLRLVAGSCARGRSR
jgi:CheY-like chemotaxis protein